MGREPRRMLLSHFPILTPPTPQRAQQVPRGRLPGQLTHTTPSRAQGWRPRIAGSGFPVASPSVPCRQLPSLFPRFSDKEPSWKGTGLGLESLKRMTSCSSSAYGADCPAVLSQQPGAQRPGTVMARKPGARRKKASSGDLGPPNEPRDGEPASAALVALSGSITQQLSVRGK